MTLDEVAALEREWLDRQPHGGSLERMHVLNQEMGVYEAGQAVFVEYVLLARRGDIEALKRALFMYWYSWSEPNELSGLFGLAQDLAAVVLGIVDDMARRGELDIELKWMLPYYYMIYPLYLDHLWHDKFPNLWKASQTNKKLWQRRGLESSFDNRGQMGEYWRSIQENC
ncbi:MAG: hypothetical protein JW993_00285 [Sedimentisphaerales bacterium]|nr:hypothetical protein [Sedimentisphaerales bacterium]